MITILYNKITIDLYSVQISDETQITIKEGDNLTGEKFRFRNLSNENKQELLRFFEELRNYFGFKLEKPFFE